MVLVLRALATLIGLLLLVVLAAAGLAAAIFSLQAGDGTLSLSQLASLLSLDDVRDSVGGWLTGLEAGGPVAVVAALSGAGAALLGLGLLIGALVPRRERLLIIERSPRGVLSAKRRAAASALQDLAQQPRVVLAAKVRVRPRRRRIGGRARVTLVHAQTPEPGRVLAAARGASEPLAEQLSLRLRLRRRRREQRRARRVS